MPEPVAAPKPEEDSAKGLSRREFACRAALATVAAAVAPRVLVSQETAPKPASTPSVPPQAEAQLSPALQAEGELKYQWVIQNYGSRLSETEKQDVHRLVMEGQKPLASLRAFPLENSDQPATVLKFTDAEMAGARSEG